MKKVLMAASAAFFACMSTPALSQAPCGDEKTVLELLQDDYDEYVQWRGKGDRDVEFVLTTNAQGAWSLLAIRGGIACLVAAGEVSALSKGV
jgi:hypothetical protein